MKLVEKIGDYAIFEPIKKECVEDNHPFPCYLIFPSSTPPSRASFASNELVSIEDSLSLARSFCWRNSGSL